MEDQSQEGSICSRNPRLNILKLACPEKPTRVRPCVPRIAPASVRPCVPRKAYKSSSLASRNVYNIFSLRCENNKRILPSLAQGSPKEAGETRGAGEAQGGRMDPRGAILTKCHQYLLIMQQHIHLRFHHTLGRFNFNHPSNF